MKRNVSHVVLGLIILALVLLAVLFLDVKLI